MNHFLGMFLTEAFCEQGLVELYVDKLSDYPDGDFSVLFSQL
jgi:hypothetical protein